MAGRNEVIEAARRVGLYVAYYNPGDNPSWKFTLEPMQYFAISGADEIGVVRGTASAALLWLRGYGAALAVSAAADVAIARHLRSLDERRA